MNSRRLNLAALAAAATGLTGCGTTDITRPRVEAALLPTFENLYLQQAQILGHTAVTRESMAATQDCDKGGPSLPNAGTGADWSSMIHCTRRRGRSAGREVRAPGPQQRLLHRHRALPDHRPRHDPGPSWRRCAEPRLRVRRLLRPRRDRHRRALHAVSRLRLGRRRRPGSR